MKISIIIAAYNIENYISECLKSCINQNVPIDEYEIIVVNDGSTDHTREIISEFVEKYNNIKIIDKDNGGLSSARNKGLDCASGDYVWFVDGDDRIKENCLGYLIEIISKERLDCYMVNYSTFESIADVSEKQLNRFPILPINPVDYVNTYKNIMPMMAWLTIASLEFLKRNQLEFTVDILHEDFDFSVREMALCKKIEFIDSSLYLYRINRAGSIMNEIKRLKSLKSHYIIYNVWESFFMKHKCNPTYEKIAMATLSSFIYFNKDYSRMDIIKKEDFSRQLKERIWHGSVKQRIKLLIFQIFPRKLFYKLFPLIG